MTAQRIPTDKNGSVYYGPTTLAEAKELIVRLNGYDYDLIDAGRENEVDRSVNHAESIADALDAAGYSKIAASVRKTYTL